MSSLTCKGTLRQVFIRVYFRLEIQSFMLVFADPAVAPLQVNLFRWQHFELPSMSLIFLQVMNKCKHCLVRLALLRHFCAWSTFLPSALYHFRFKLRLFLQMSKDLRRCVQRFTLFLVTCSSLSGVCLLRAFSFQTEIDGYLRQESFYFCTMFANVLVFQQMH